MPGAHDLPQSPFLGAWRNRWGEGLNHPDIQRAGQGNNSVGGRLGPVAQH